MILRRLADSIRHQNWFAVFVDLAVVFVGVFVGIQVANWNEARLDAVRKQQIIEALIADISDSIIVQRRFIDEIDTGLLEWTTANTRGDRPSPFYFRIEGAETAPDIWGTLQQMQLIDLFDSVTLFDLSFYYSELAGVGRKYARYINFVEESVLPYAEVQPEIFYDPGNSMLKPVYRANLDRLRDFRDESERLLDWAACLVFRLSADRTFESTCLRADFVLEGMNESASSQAP